LDGSSGESAIKASVGCVMSVCLSVCPCVTIQIAIKSDIIKFTRREEVKEELEEITR